VLAPRPQPANALRATAVHDDGGVRVHDVVCSACAGSGDVETSHGFGLVLVRRGAFHRNTGRGRAVLEPGAAYVARDGEEQRIAHPRDGGDACTAIDLEPDLFAAMLGGATDPLPEPVLTAPRADLAGRLLLARARAGAAADRDALTESLVALCAGVLASAAPARAAAGAPATAAARRRAADGVREALCEDTRLRLADLACLTGYAPHHLTRVFRERTGLTIGAYRARLRVRAALERLAEGERDLGRLAQDAGFADHAHLSRSLRAATGSTPSALRAALRSG
jgi:AraC-like DNA-binding protein